MSQVVTAERRLSGYLKLAKDFLEKRGIENPRGDAEVLLGKALGLPRIELYLQHDRPLSDNEVSNFRELLRRRAQYEPLQLIMGSVEFYGAQIELHPGLLVPRQETEQLAHLVHERLCKHVLGHSPRMLDIGSGSGCISVALAKAVANLAVDSVDIDFSAVRATMRNALANGVGERIQAFHADIFSDRFLSLVSPPYDLVVSNPPYIRRDDIPRLKPEVREHESHTALDGGDDGLQFYRRIAALAPQLCGRSTFFALEIGYGQERDVTSLFEKISSHVTVEKDLSGIKRFLLASIGGINP